MSFEDALVLEGESIVPNEDVLVLEGESIVPNEDVLVLEGETTVPDEDALVFDKEIAMPVDVERILPGLIISERSSFPIALITVAAEFTTV